MLYSIPFPPSHTPPRPHLPPGAHPAMHTLPSSREAGVFSSPTHSAGNGSPDAGSCCTPMSCLGCCRGQEGCYISLLPARTATSEQNCLSHKKRRRFHLQGSLWTLQTSIPGQKATYIQAHCPFPRRTAQKSKPTGRLGRAWEGLCGAGGVFSHT